MTNGSGHGFHPRIPPRNHALAARAVEDMDTGMEMVGALFAPVGPPEDWDLSIEDQQIPGPSGQIRLRVPVVRRGTRPP